MVTGVWWKEERGLKFITWARPYGLLKRRGPPASFPIASRRFIDLKEEHKSGCLPEQFFKLSNFNRTTSVQRYTIQGL